MKGMIIALAFKDSKAHSGLEGYIKASRQNKLFSQLFFLNHTSSQTKLLANPSLCVLG